MSGPWRRWLAWVVLSGAMTVPLGPPSTQRATEQMNRDSMRGVAPPPATPAPRPDMIWVPDRWVPVPGVPTGVFEPGHWVIYTPEGGHIAPPPPPGAGPATPLPPRDKP